MYRTVVAIFATATVLVACTPNGSHTTAMKAPVGAAHHGRTSTADAPQQPAGYRACARHNLRARYAGAGNGGQTHFGLVVIWNAGDRACRISGTPRFSATLADGRRDRHVLVNQSADHQSMDAVLPARTAAYRDGHLTPGRYLMVEVAAPHFTRHGDCADARSTLRLLTPATFTVVFDSITFRVDNDDPAAAQNAMLNGCEGRLIFNPPRISF